MPPPPRIGIWRTLTNTLMQDPYTSHFQKVSLKSNEPNWRYVVKLYSGPDFFNYPTNCTIHLHLENQIFTRRAFLQNDLRTSKAFHFWFFAKISLILFCKNQLDFLQNQPGFVTFEASWTSTLNARDQKNLRAASEKCITHRYTDRDRPTYTTDL